MTQQEILSLNKADILAKLQSSADGITEADAEKRIDQNGRNKIAKKSVSGITVLLRQFKSSLVYLLVVAAVISYAIKDISDGTVILIILLINTFIGFFEEYRSEKTIEKLTEFISHQVWLKRDGQVKLFDQTEIVVGDVLVVHEGDIAPADIRLLEADNLQIDESPLTGESVPVTKRASDDKTTMENIVLAGSTVEKGEGFGVVYATGNDTELGTIAVLSTATEKDTPYQKSLQSFSALLVKAALLGLTLIFIFKLFLVGKTASLADLLIFILALAVAVVPEVLPVIATISLSSGALKLAKKNVVVKRLSSLEDLGNIDILCTDKTGTITENKMAIKAITSSDDQLFQKFAYATFAPPKGVKRKLLASYDDAFIAYVSPEIKTSAESLHVMKELPFDPDDRRRRVVLEDFATKKEYLVVLGAPDTLLTIAASDHKDEYLANMAKEGQEGLHHLALAYKEISNFSADFDIIKNETNLTFLGYASLFDPLRPSAKMTIEHAKKLGIQIKIITGDGREVAEYVGRQINLVQDGDKIYLGSELDAMSPADMKKAVMTYHVFARITPEQKYNIIKVLKETNTVGYQGDGINDAAALKLADVAIAVNTATDIAKENADIILLNKSLEVIINGIKYGRSIFVNINKYIKYTMVGNFGNFIALGVLYLISLNLPLLPIQILLTNVLTDIPLIMVSFDNVEDADVKKPEKHDMKGLMLISMILGVPTALFELFYFLLIKDEPLHMLQTSFYIFLTFMGLILFYAIRNKKPFWKAKFPPLGLNLAFLVALVVSLGMIYIPEFHKLFSFVSLSVASVAIIIAFTLAYFFATDLMKVFFYKEEQRVE